MLEQPDLYLATAALRAAATGRRVWTFDPQRIAHAGQGWWWNPLAGRLRLDDATRLAGAFVMAVADDEHREIWGPAATELLANLLLRDLLDLVPVDYAAERAHRARPQATPPSPPAARAAAAASA